MASYWRYAAIMLAVFLKLLESYQKFWIITHGIKASGMPAWGPGHDDERIWNMVAFLQRLPRLTAEQYQILTARSNSSVEHGH